MRDAVSFWPKANNGKSRAMPRERYRERLIAEASFLDQHLRLPIVTVYFEISMQSSRGLERVKQEMSANLGVYRSYQPATLPQTDLTGRLRNNGNIHSIRHDPMQPTTRTLGRR